jgi:hypothetical protein
MLSNYALPVEVDEGSQRDLARSLGVQLPHHHLNLLLRQRLLQLHCQVGQVVLADEPLALSIDLPEDPLQVLTGIPLVGTLEDHAQKLTEIDVSALVLVVDRHRLVDSVALGVVTVVVLRHRLQQVPRRQEPVLVSVECIEDLLPNLSLPLTHVVGHELAGDEGLAP